MKRRETIHVEQPGGRNVYYSCGKWSEIAVDSLFIRKKDYLMNRKWARMKPTPYTRVLDKLTVSQLVKKFPAFDGILRIIIVFTRARHWYPP
jgi:hypothetical protein